MKPTAVSANDHRVLLVGKGPPEPGGLPACLEALQHSVLARTHGIDLLNLTRDVEPQSGRFTLANIRRTWSDMLLLWRALPGVELVHVHSAVVPGATAIRAAALCAVARLRGRRVLLHVHGGLLPDWIADSTRRQRLLKLCLRPADEVVVVSVDARGALLDVTSRPVVHIRNGVALDRFRPATSIAERPPRVLYAGQLTQRKGTIDLLRASAQLHDRGVPHELVLVGGDHEEGWGAAEEVRRAAGAHVRFLGPQPLERMPEIYAGADIFCLPSWWEAMPMSVLEAMASGLPVVASRVGDIPSMVADGRDGRLVNPRDPDGLADALEELLTDHQGRLAMGRHARTTAVERFSLDGTVAAVAARYDEMLATHYARGRWRSTANP